MAPDTTKKRNASTSSSDGSNTAVVIIIALLLLAAGGLQIHTMQEDAKAMEANITQRDTTIASLTSELETSQSTLKQTKAALEEAKALQSKLEKSSKSCSTNLDNCEERSAKLVQDIGVWEVQLKKCQEESKTAKPATSSSSDAEKKLEKQKEQNKQLSDSLTECRGELKSARHLAASAPKEAAVDDAEARAAKKQNKNPLKRIGSFFHKIARSPIFFNMK